MSPDGDCLYRFENIKDMPNLLNRYSRWQLQSTRSLQIGKGVRFVAKRCVGVLFCSLPTSACRVSALRPKQNDPNDFNISCRNGCGDTIIRQECNAKMFWIFKGNRAIVEHLGVHGHACPIVNKADHFDRAALRTIISQNPQKSAMQLVVGKPGVDGCKFSVRQLHSSFGNKDRVAYFRREILEELGVTVPCHGDMSIGLMQFHQTFGTTVVKSSSMQFSNMHISWATQFMAERVADFEDLSGRKLGEP
eukprot:CRZ06715.1 hypothetical protein [Spongospora subterranea]